MAFVSGARPADPTGPAGVTRRPARAHRTWIAGGALTGFAVGLVLVVAALTWLFVRSLQPYGDVEAAFDDAFVLGGVPVVVASSIAAGTLAGLLGAMVDGAVPTTGRRALLALAGALPAGVATWVVAVTLLLTITPRGNGYGVLRWDSPFGAGIGLAGAVAGAVLTLRANRPGRPRSIRPDRVVVVPVVVGAGIGAVIGALDPVLLWLDLAPGPDLVELLPFADAGSDSVIGPLADATLPAVPWGFVTGALEGAALGFVLAVVLALARRYAPRRSTTIALVTAAVLGGTWTWIRILAVQGFDGPDPFAIFRAARGQRVGDFFASVDVASGVGIALVGAVTVAAIALVTIVVGIDRFRPGRAVVVGGAVVGALAAMVDVWWNVLTSAGYAAFGPHSGAFAEPVGNLSLPTPLGVALSAAGGAVLGVLVGLTIAVAVERRTSHGTAGRPRVGTTAALCTLVVVGPVLLFPSLFVDRNPFPRDAPTSVVVLDLVLGIGAPLVVLAATIAASAAVARTVARSRARRSVGA